MWSARAMGWLLIRSAKLLTGAYADWNGCRPEARQRLYFANHSSHLDFVLLWAMLPAFIRATTRPVSAREYWSASALRRYLIEHVFRAVQIDRTNLSPTRNPLAAMQEALSAGDSLILFPEGTRSTGETLLPFKSGLYHLAQANPQLELIPVRIENLNRVMPKGEALPVPLICTLRFGAPIQLATGEPKEAFLARARQSIIDLKAPSSS